MDHMFSEISHLFPSTDTCTSNTFEKMLKSRSEDCKTTVEAVESVETAVTVETAT